MMQVFSENVYDCMTASVVETSLIALDCKWVSVCLIFLDIAIFHSFNFSLL